LRNDALSLTNAAKPGSVSFLYATNPKPMADRARRLPTGNPPPLRAAAFFSPLPLLFEGLGTVERSARIDGAEDLSLASFLPCLPILSIFASLRNQSKILNTILKEDDESLTSV
jgi:hypothetical protein